MSLQDMLSDTRRRREADAARFASLDNDLCQLCLAHGSDKRNLFIACFYAVHEVVPEAIDLFGVPDPDLAKRGYFLRICKACRGRLLGHLEEWRRECLALRGIPKDHDGDPLEEDPKRNIPVRVHGMVQMLTLAEWEAEYRERMEGEGNA